MSFKWDASTEARFQKRTHEQSCKSYSRMYEVALSLFGVFAILDFVIQPPSIRLLSLSIRILTLLILFPFYLRTRKPHPPKIVMVALVGIAASGVIGMSWVSGGYKSSFYFGLSIMILANSHLFPWGPKKVAALNFSIAGAYLLAIILKTHGLIDQPLRFIDNVAFVTTCSLVSVWGAWISDRLRRQTFAMFMETERAREQIEDAVVLSREMVDQNQELQQEVWSEQIAKASVTRALKTRDEFISIASHELKTPITVMKLQLELLKKFIKRLNIPEPRAELQTFLSRNEEQIRRLLRLVDDMLDLSRISTGTMRFELSPTKLSSVVNDAVERLIPQLAEAKIYLTLDLDSDSLGNWDNLRLEQLVSNLVINAIKYAPNSPLDIRIRQTPLDVTLEVRDHGPGIVEEQRQKIFDRFERGSAKMSAGGLGLGLYISRQIAHGHGGRIEIVPVQGPGTCFRVTLPRRSIQSQDGLTTDLTTNLTTNLTTDRLTREFGPLIAPPSPRHEERL